jgi:hypothetical protein
MKKTWPGSLSGELALGLGGILRENEDPTLPPVFASCTRPSASVFYSSIVHPSDLLVSFFLDY